jgi:hypothetical protein
MIQLLILLAAALLIFWAVLGAEDTEYDSEVH